MVFAIKMRYAKRNSGKETICMKKLLSICLILCLTLGLGVSTLADSEHISEARAIIGADLNEAQIESVYDDFGVERGAVTELTVTNEEERHYLEGLVEESLIGTRSISCVYVELLEDGQGLQVETKHLTWCTETMFVNALVTAGVEDARIIVTAPFDVSGTAALTGIYKAYEDITGTAMDDVAKLVSTQELIVTGELADTIGQWDAASIVNELKLMLDKTETMSNEELGQAIQDIAAEYGITLVDSQVQQLLDLCRGLEKLDGDTLKEKVEQVQKTIQKLGDAQEKISGIVQTLKGVVETVRGFIVRVLSFFGMGE